MNTFKKETDLAPTGDPVITMDSVREKFTVGFRPLAMISRQFARRLLTIGENRLEVLTAEVQEERDRFLGGMLLGFGVAAFGLVTCIALAATIVVLLWAHSPVTGILVLTALCGAAGIWLCRFPPRSINSERLVHGWEESSAEPARIVEATVNHRKETQPRPAVR
jgi:uncharacterized membrane protein YqjE